MLFSNPALNCGEVAIIKSQVGLNIYEISVKEWVKKPNPIVLTSTAERYVHPQSHPNIVVDFTMLTNPDFKPLEFERLMN